jgi:hypothetical protein
MRLAFA